MISRGSSTFPRDLLIFRPCLSRTMEWRSTWRHAGGQQKGLGTGGRPGMWGTRVHYLAERELPCELGPQHDHAAHPEHQEVTASFQKRKGVETSEVWRLGQDKQ